MEETTTEKERLLENHALYGLDKMILEYLEPILEREVGVAFQNYCTKRKILAEEMEKETYLRGAKLTGQPIHEVAQLQEQLLLPVRFEPEINRAWAEVKKAAKGEWLELCALYQCILTEAYDLERMAVAQQAAKEHGDAAHAVLVQNVMDLEGSVAPAWWRDV